MTTQADNDSFTLPGEGERKIVERVRVREECERCGDPATKKHNYLLPDARRNPASSGYGGDDISWCSDHATFTCGSCPRPSVDGYSWGGTFSVSPDNVRFAHMFLRWSEREVEQVAS